MIKVTYFLKRKQGMSLEEFHRYWRDIHSPIAAKIPGLKKYILCYPLPTNDGNAPFCDGIAELWFENEAEFEKAKKSEEWRVSGEDGEVFIAQPSSSILLREETII